MATVAVLGSCVSRDAFSLAPRDGLGLGAYIARSSFASAFSPQRVEPEVVATTASIESAFQRRMVNCDLEKTALAALLDPAPNAICIDLIDERFSVGEYHGTYLTISPEFTRSGFPLDSLRRIAPDSREHWGMWCDGVARFLACVGTGNVVLNKVFWAAQDIHGDMLPQQEQIRASNDLLRARYEHLDGLGIERTIDYPESLLVADPGHKWGLSPFHYSAGFYQHTMAELDRLLS